MSTLERRNSDALETQYRYMFKIVVIGDSCVGKTTLTNQFTSGKKGPEEHVSTICVDFGIKIVNVGAPVKLQIWDTAGQECFRSITSNYYQNSTGFVAVYDVTRRESFYHVQEWIDQVKKACQENVVGILIGNKTDKKNRSVTHEEGKKLAFRNNMMFIETNFNNQSMVEEPFVMLANKIYQMVLNQEIKTDNLHGIVDNHVGKKRGKIDYNICCTVC